MGSGNYEARKYDGWVEGDARYASQEPHHDRSEGGAWIYVSMYSAARERLLSLIIDGEYETDDETETASGKLVTTVGIVERFPCVTASAADDYSAPAARTYLMRENCSSSEEIEIFPGDDNGFDLYSDGWDHVEMDEWTHEWVAVYYRATIERDCGCAARILTS